MKEIVQTTIKRPYFDVVVNYRKDDPDDLAVIKEMFIDNVYHLEAYKIEGGVVLDIGANIGLFTLQVLKVAQENNLEVVVYAIEPEKNNLELLKKNLEDNPQLLENGSRVVIVDCGVSGYNGEATITDGSGSSRITKEIDHTLQKIDVVTYNKLLYELDLDKIDFVKIDIEGSELYLVKWAKKESLVKAHYYAIECDRANDKNSFLEILAPFLDDFSFSTWGIPNNGCNLYLENHNWKTND